MTKSSITVTAPKGLVPFLKNELAELGFPIVWASENAVGTEGSYDDSMRLNLWLRTAHHVLYGLMSFSCTSLDDLYRSVRAFSWERVIDERGYLSVVATVNNPSIRDHRIVNLKCKDAIVDRIAAQRGRRPDSGSERSGAVVSVFWQQNRCTVSIDTSGEPLSKRGYRRIPLAAPMQETLAAAIVLASGYDGCKSFVNPMCGSGTIAIEAALIGSKAAPGLTRDTFGFMHTKYFDRSRWNDLKQQADSLRQKSAVPVRIVAGDMNPEAIQAARQNAAAARVDGLIDFRNGDFSATPMPSPPGVVLFNPEYGIRLGNEAQLIETYRTIGSFMKHSCAGYRGYVFTGNSNLAGKIGLKARRKWNFQSGKIDCRLYEYELFEGKKS